MSVLPDRNIPDDPIRRNFEAIDQQLALVSPALAVSSLPENPEDGTEVYYVADSSVLWHLKYRATTGKWHFVGGPPLLDFQTDNATKTTGGASSWGDPDTGSAGPSITLPLAGDYEVSFGLGLVSNDTATFYALMGVALNAGTPSLVNCVGAYTHTSFSTYIYGVQNSLRLTGAAANDVLNVKYSRWGGGTAFFGPNRWLRATPVRLDAI